MADGGVGALLDRGSSNIQDLAQADLSYRLSRTGSEGHSVTDSRSFGPAGGQGGGGVAAMVQKGLFAAPAVGLRIEKVQVVDSPKHSPSQAAVSLLTDQVGYLKQRPKITDADRSAKKDYNAVVFFPFFKVPEELRMYGKGPVSGGDDDDDDGRHRWQTQASDAMAAEHESVQLELSRDCMAAEMKLEAQRKFCELVLRDGKPIPQERAHLLDKIARLRTLPAVVAKMFRLQSVDGAVGPPHEAPAAQPLDAELQMTGEKKKKRALEDEVNDLLPLMFPPQNRYVIWAANEDDGSIDDVVPAIEDIAIPSRMRLNFFALEELPAQGGPPRRRSSLGQSPVALKETPKKPPSMDRRTEPTNTDRTTKSAGCCVLC